MGFAKNTAGAGPNATEYGCKQRIRPRLASAGIAEANR
jgi:hypothetical protein